MRGSQVRSYKHIYSCNLQVVIKRVMYQIRYKATFLKCTSLLCFGVKIPEWVNVLTNYNLNLNAVPKLAACFHGEGCVFKTLQLIWYYTTYFYVIPKTYRCAAMKRQRKPFFGQKINKY